MVVSPTEPDWKQEGDEMEFSVRYIAPSCTRPKRFCLLLAVERRRVIGRAPGPSPLVALPGTQVGKVMAQKEKNQKGHYSTYC